MSLRSGYLLPVSISTHSYDKVRYFSIEMSEIVFSAIRMLLLSYEIAMDWEGDQ